MWQGEPLLGPASRLLQIGEGLSSGLRKVDYCPFAGLVCSNNFRGSYDNLPSLMSFSFH